MQINNRQEAILKILEQKKQVRVTSLAKELYASEMTIRRDLEYLENEGMLIRCHGGAVPVGNHLHFPIKYRMWINSKEKKELAVKATSYLADGQVLFFNSSSTCAYLIPYLKDYKDIQVITNSLHLVSLLEKIHIPCILPGGKYREVEQCLSGSITEQYLMNINPDVAFLSCEGLTEDGTITESREDMAHIARIACNNARHSVFLMDASKLGKRYTYTVCTKEYGYELIVI